MKAILVLIAVLAAAGSVAWLRFGGAYAQAAPSLTLSPDSGPCDATITVALSGFRPNETVPLEIGRPASGSTQAALAPAITDAEGSYSGQRMLGSDGCAAAEMADALLLPQPRMIVIFAGADPVTHDVEARASYAYTTSTSSSGDVATATSTTAATPTTSPPSADGSSNGSDRTWVIAAAAVGGLIIVTIAAWLIWRVVRRSRWSS